MIRMHHGRRFGNAGLTMVFLSGWAFAGAASCAGGEDVPLFDNAGGKSGGSGGHAGSISGTSGSVSNGGSGGSGQGGSGQGGSAQGGSAQGGSAQGGSAGAATAGSSGAGGSGGSAGTDAGMSNVPTSCDKLPLGGTPVSGQGVTLQYQNTGADPADATIAFNLELTASTTLALNQLEVCYFFTNEVTSPTTLELYYAGAGNAGREITAKIRKRVVPAALGPGIDSFLSYTIDDTGTVASGEKIKINPAFHSSDYQQKLNENNDYSYDGSATGFKDNPRIAVYLNGTLIWGGGPAASTPEGGTDGAPDVASPDGAASDASADSPADQTSLDSATDAGTDATADAGVE